MAYALLAATALYVAAALAFRLGLSRPWRPGKTGASPFVSVVIAARNEETHLSDCLERLARQTYPADRLEVLVIDDGSEDRTGCIAAGFAASHPNFRALSTGDAFPHLAAKKRPLSVGIAQARGDIILTTDADCRVPSTWVSGIASAFEPGVDAVLGFSQIKTPGSPLSFFERLQGFDFLALMSAAAGSANLGFPLAASGQNLAYRKTVFERIGGFASIGHRPSGDDVLLLQLLRRAASGRVVFSVDPGTFVSTWRTESPRGFWRQRIRWASNAAYQAKLNPPFFVYIAAVFLINLLAPFGLIFGLTPGGRVLPLVCWAAKALADLLVARGGARLFGRADLLPAFPAWEILQAPYTILVGLFGSLGRFTWKGRRHR